MIQFLKPLAEQQPTDDLPRDLDIDLAVFHKKKRAWLTWRACGYTDAGGAFVRPVTFLEALQMPPEELRLFLDLDTYFDKLHQQFLNKTKKK